MVTDQQAEMTRALVRIANAFEALAAAYVHRHEMHAGDLVDIDMQLERLGFFGTEERHAD